MGEKLYKITKDFDYYSRISTINFEKLLFDLFKRDTKYNKKNNTVSRDNIEKDIIIAQARNQDIDKLIQEIILKYS